MEKTVEAKPLNSSRDINKLKDLISEHYQCTNSEKAKDILENFEVYLKKFLKVTSPIYEKQLNLKELVQVNNNSYPSF